MMRRISAALIVAFLPFLIGFAVGHTRSEVKPRKTVQMRVFAINRGEMDRFLDAWKSGVYPLREREGFRVEGAWAIRERNEFIWILSYDGAETFQRKDSAYYASQARQRLDPDPARLIARAESWFVTEVVPRR